MFDSFRFVKRFDAMLFALYKSGLLFIIIIILAHRP